MSSCARAFFLRSAASRTLSIDRRAHVIAPMASARSAPSPTAARHHARDEDHSCDARCSITAISPTTSQWSWSAPNASASIAQTPLAPSPRSPSSMSAADVAALPALRKAAANMTGAERARPTAAHCPHQTTRARIVRRWPASPLVVQPSNQPAISSRYNPGMHHRESCS